MATYSLDLREKVIIFIKQGNSQKLATQVFNLNKATVNRWWLRHKKEGHVNPRKHLGSKSKIDKSQLIKYVQSNANCRLSDLGLIFKVSGESIYYCLKKLGFSYKKKRLPMWKQVKKRDVSIKS